MNLVTLYSVSYWHICITCWTTHIHASYMHCKWRTPLFSFIYAKILIYCCKYIYTHINTYFVQWYHLHKQYFEGYIVGWCFDTYIKKKTLQSHQQCTKNSSSSHFSKVIFLWVAFFVQPLLIPLLISVNSQLGYEGEIFLWW